MSVCVCVCVRARAICFHLSVLRRSHVSCDVLLLVSHVATMKRFTFEPLLVGSAFFLLVAPLDPRRGPHTWLCQSGSGSLNSGKP